MSVAWVGAGIAVVGAVSSKKQGDKAMKQQQGIADAAQESQDFLLQEQVRQADELLAFNKLQYEEGKKRQEGIDEINKKVIDQNLAISAKDAARADESYDFYQRVGRPAVEKSIQEAQDYDSAGNIEAARGRATADVNQAFDNTAEQTQRTLTRLGVSPSSGRFLALQQRLQADRAAATAGAGSNAEQHLRDGAIGLRTQAANLAQGFPAQSLAQGGQSAGVGVGAAGVAGAGQSQHMALAGAAMDGMQAGTGIYGNAARGYSSMQENAMNRMGMIASQTQKNMQGWGNMLGGIVGGGGLAGGLGGWVNSSGTGINWVNGGMADGGKVGGDKNADGSGGKITGPGTGTSDEVLAVNKDSGQPVMLSNGEYVISADVVRKLGTKFFDNLQAKHHTPVNSGNLRKAA